MCQKCAVLQIAILFTNFQVFPSILYVDKQNWDYKALCLIYQNVSVLLNKMAIKTVNIQKYGLNLKS